MEKTREHFIPQNIGGISQIHICKKSNEYAGSTCDKILDDISYHYKVFKNSSFKRDCHVVLKSGEEFNGRCVIINGPPYVSSCSKHASNEVVKVSEIDHITFPVTLTKHIISTYPVIAKIALGSIYYLIIKDRATSKDFLKIFKDATFADLRKLFSGEFSPGGKLGKGCSLMSMDSREATSTLEKINIKNRVHYTSIETIDDVLVVRIVLFSCYFWVVKIPNIGINIPFREECTVLHNLKMRNDDYKNASALMYTDKIIKVMVE